MTEKLEALKQLAETLPKEVQANALGLVERMGTKIEGIGDNPIEWRPENLRVVQPSSDRSKLPKGSQIGSILLGEKQATQPLKNIPIRIWNSRQMWSPDKDENKLLCFSPDGNIGYKYGLCKDCQYGKFDEEAGKSACNKGKTILGITEDLTTIFTATFSKTNYQNGLQWEKLMKKAGVATFKRVYELRTETSKKYKNVESLLVETQNQNTPAEHLAFLESLFNKFNEDRKIYLQKFEETVRLKREDVALLVDHSKSTDGNELPATQALPTPEQATMAKKYEL
jgi:hypothetical protein